MSKGKLELQVAKSFLKIVDMEETGKATLYLTQRGAQSYVTNETNTLSFPVYFQRKSRHNWYNLTRTDVWFATKNGVWWHGRHVGNDNTIVHCKRIKSPLRAGLPRAIH